MREGEESGAWPCLSVDQLMCSGVSAVTGSARLFPPAGRSLQLGRRVHPPESCPGRYVSLIYGRWESARPGQGHNYNPRDRRTWASTRTSLWKGFRPFGWFRFYQLIKCTVGWTLLNKCWSRVDVFLMGTLLTNILIRSSHLYPILHRGSED